MKLIITRHGETEENVNGIIQGQLPGKLSEKGIEQAKKLALRLKDEKIDHIYSSDLTRAADTAKLIADYHKNTPFTLTKELRERSLGEFEGESEEEFGSGAKDRDGIYPQPKEGETLDELYQRGKDFLKYLKKTYTNETILLVGHGGIDLAIIGFIENKGPKYVELGPSLANTSVTIIEVNKENYNLLTLNSILHLV
ncbi:histidine phosphatase family protein [archaeon]|jgi:broad specificity phosphatase PhoE|nr:histidine phosphatase family protein [archaeon]MBT4397415.1 histidine phosphatase family protein [archaeon]MBT4440487.1 histidine phosphatase family protein [archaeon]